MSGYVFINLEQKLRCSFDCKMQGHCALSEVRNHNLSLFRPILHIHNKNRFYGQGEPENIYEIHCHDKDIKICE